MAKSETEGEEFVQQGGVMANLKQEAEDKFKQKHGWTDLANSIAKETLTSFFVIMDKPVLAVLYLGSYLQDKVEIIELRNSK